VEKITTLQSTVACLPVNDIDTDQIIPARYLKTTEKSGLGEHLFEDWRYTRDGSPIPGFVLNQAESQGAQVLLVGSNFGCGSSREHAPWALRDYGFRAILATSFADIFRNNALKNGLLLIGLEPGEHQALLHELESNPQATLTIDLPRESLTLSSGLAWNFSIDGYSKSCLVNGTDELGYILHFAEQIRQYEQKTEAL
jgi:3-isopropylmalate/(R)-2-methylmalate dehydratase small subunit